MPEGKSVVIDHFAVEVDDVEAGAHLWTVPATSSGFRLQMTERVGPSV